MQHSGSDTHHGRKTAYRKSGSHCKSDLHHDKCDARPNLNPAQHTEINSPEIFQRPPPKPSQVESSPPKPNLVKPAVLANYNDLLTVADLAEIFRVSKQTIRKEMKCGKFGASIQIGRAYLIPKISILSLYFSDSLILHHDDGLNLYHDGNGDNIGYRNTLEVSAINF